MLLLYAVETICKGTHINLSRNLVTTYQSEDKSLLIAVSLKKNCLMHLFSCFKKMEGQNNS